jgi:hypothetical protein
VDKDKNYLFLVWSSGVALAKTLLVHQALLLSPKFSIIFFPFSGCPFLLQQNKGK